jgi:predicted acyltransferase
VNSRLISLDFFRGLTIAAMIVVNDPGSWSYVYPPLRHAEWHGVTPTDLVFPFFLFIVGVSIVLALSKRKQTDSSIYFKIIKRSIIIFAIGLFLALFPNFDFENLRVAGVLQRIALVYLFGSIIYLNSTFIIQIWLGIILLILYWVFMTYIPFGDSIAGTLDPGNNFAAWVDQYITPGRMYQKTWDPEGFFSTIPAIASGISGMFCGHVLLNQSKDLKDKIILIFVADLAQCV